MPQDYQQSLHEAANNYTIKIEYDGNNNPIYIGKAKVGTLTTDALWQIQKLTFTGTNPTNIQWANGNDDFLNIWDNRTGLSYS